MDSYLPRVFGSSSGGFLLFGAVVLSALVATAAAFRAGRRIGGPTGRAWYLMGAGSALSAVAPGVATYEGASHGAMGFGPLVHALCLVGFLATAGGLALLPTSAGIGRVRSLLDGGIIAASSLFVAWNLVLRFFPPAEPGVALFTALAYPAGDLLIGVAVLAALARYRRIDLALLGFAVLARGIANAAHGVVGLSGEHAIEIVSVGWLLWLALTAAAASLAVAQPEPQRAAAPGPLYVAMPYLAVGGAIAVRIWTVFIGQPVTQVGVALLSAAIVLVVIRQAIIVVENERLQRSLANRLDDLATVAQQRKEALDLVDGVLTGLPGGAYRYIYGPDGVDGAHGRRVFASAGFCQLAGYSTDEMTEVDAQTDLAHPDDWTVLKEAARRALAGDGELNATHRILTKQGDVRWVANRGRVSREDGAVVVNGLVVDITEDRREAKQAEHNRRIEAVGQLAGGVAHDINNIVTALQWHSELLRRDIADDHALRPHVDGVSDAGDRVAALARQLLSFARNERGVVELVDAGAVARSMEPLLQSLAEPDVVVAVFVEPAPLVLIDRCRFEQALLNLALNAIDACRRSAKSDRYVIVSVRTDSVGDTIVDVGDNGVGMDAETQERCFDPFFTTKGSRGSGLGLAAVSAVVQEAHGEFLLDSTPGAGTNIALVLPAAAEPVARPAQERISAPAARGRILVVDDDADVGATAGRALERGGFTVTVTTSPAEAFGLVGTNDFDLLLTDYVMPEITGLDLVRGIQARGDDVRTLVMTGAPDAHLQELDVIEKPFTGAELVAAVDAVLTATELPSRV